jgi:hypothetical protein
MYDEACTRPFTEASHRCECGWLAVSTHGLSSRRIESNRPGDSSMGSPRVYTRQVSQAATSPWRTTGLAVPIGVILDRILGGPASLCSPVGSEMDQVSVEVAAAASEHRPVVQPGSVFLVLATQLEVCRGRGAVCVRALDVVVRPIGLMPPLGPTPLRSRSPGSDFGRAKAVLVKRISEYTLRAVLAAMVPPYGLCVNDVGNVLLAPTGLSDGTAT